MQDDFEVKGKVIDQKTYFRQAVFGRHPWQQVRPAPFVEATMVEFDLFLFGEFIGRFELQVRHKPSGAAGQGNYTTSIWWGKVGDIIKESNPDGPKA
ncbi:MAG: hypothetical protein IPM82_17110 [Saprospiraceae bacterium]|nr:hypothetical protein [Saprospiraceae bacterium]